MRDDPRRPAECRAVIFDFDGLLMDTETSLLRSWQYEWQQWGLQLSTDDFFAPHGGDVSADRYAALAEAVGPTYDRDLSHRRRVAHRERLHVSLPLRPGIASWLQQGRRAGLRLAIASSSPRSWVETQLDRVRVLHHFDPITTGDEVTRHKPDSEIYRLALSRLGVPASAAVAVEDTPHGVTAAQGAGIACIAIPNPHVPWHAVGHARLTLASAADLDLVAAIRTAGSDAAPRL